MPKRKRPHPDNESNQELGGLTPRQQKVNDYLCKAKKELHRALKTARNFERQRLGKRLKRAETDEAKARITTEINVLKSLDIDKVVNTHLRNNLLKVKDFTTSGLLPDGVTKIEHRESKENPAEEIAFHNVVSGAIEQIIKQMYFVMGIPIPREMKKLSKIAARQKKLESDHDTTLPEDFTRIIKDDQIIEEPEADDLDKFSISPEWEGFESDQEAFCEGATPGNDEIIEESKLDQHTSISSSLNEKSSDDVEHNSRSNLEPLNNFSSSSSAALSDISSFSESLSTNLTSQPANSKSHSAKKIKSMKPKRSGLSSTFLPSLIGGYWSGSEESASDLENFAPAPKKNRPGQMARRAIAEKKYGKMAKHIMLGKSSSSFPLDKRKPRRDNDWDPKRGAIVDDAANLSRGHNRTQHMKNPYLREKSHYEKTLKENKIFNSNGTSRVGQDSTEIASRVKKAGKSKRDDLGILHPSWQAAKKAKELKETAKFQGKKIVF
ncbi:hypothetical protein HI914_07373 [Erysiphe necator]|nr:hypothetical protein HI914_07373 [Erysiphe necator]